MVNEIKKNSCCIIGHRKINSEELQLKLKNLFLDLINKENVTIFNFGKLGEFNDLCYKILIGIKKENPSIKLIVYALSDEIVYTFEEAEDYRNKYNRKEKEFKFKCFDEIIELRDIDETKFKYACVLRNKQIIDNSDLCVIYYKENYTLPSKNSQIRNSGTKIAYEYASKQNKKIIIP